VVGRALWLVLTLSLSLNAWALTVSTTLDSDRVSPGESVVVTFTADEQILNADFSPLEEEFEIVDRRQSQNIDFVNGQPLFEMAWALVLMPKRTGELTVPSIQFGDASSEPRTVTVVEEKAGPVPDGDVFINYSVDDATPYVNQQVLLTTQVYTLPDVEDLEVSAPRLIEGEAELEKLGLARQYHSMRGGRRYSVREQRYTLLPRSAGRLVLAPIEARGRSAGKPVSRRSDNLVLDVLRVTDAEPEVETDVQARSLFLEIDVAPRTPYIQEQVLYTVRVYRSVSVENATLSPVEVSGGDAVVERIGSDRVYRDTRDNQRYEVTERCFVLFPQSSGAMMINPVRLQASVPLSGTRDDDTRFWSQPMTKPVRVESEPVRLNVKPPPPEASRPWLPARNLTLTEHWPQRERFEVGTPITRRLTLRAEGLLGSQLPALEMPLPEAVKSYPERPQRSHSEDGDVVVGELEQTVAVIPSRAGTFMLPAVELAWWNTRTDEEETVRVPPRRLTVAATPAASGAADAGDGGMASGARPHTGWWVSLALAIAWLATATLWWRERRAHSPAADPVRAGDTTAASRRGAEKRLNKACAAEDPRAARDALLDWGKACWPSRPPRSLGALAALTGEPLAGEIAALERALYAPAPHPWSGATLYPAVTAFDPAASPEQAKGPVELAPLYRY